MCWTIQIIDKQTIEELEKLPITIKASMYHIMELLGKYGNQVREPHTKSLGDGLFEIRAKGKEGIARAFFAFQDKKVIIILHCFIKKSQKTPKSEINKAREKLRSM